MKIVVKLSINPNICCEEVRIGRGGSGSVVEIILTKLSFKKFS